MKKKRLLLIALGCILGIALLFGYFTYTRTTAQPNDQTLSNLKGYTAVELAQYDGTDPNKPIYIGLNGLVYDVTSGKSYYEVGGGYHWLAGKDSSKDLNLIGGDIIKRKYPVVGKIVQ